MLFAFASEQSVVILTLWLLHNRDANSSGIITGVFSSAWEILDEFSRGCYSSITGFTMESFAFAYGQWPWRYSPGGPPHKYKTRTERTTRKHSSLPRASSKTPCPYTFNLYLFSLFSNGNLHQIWPGPPFASIRYRTSGLPKNPVASGRSVSVGRALGSSPLSPWFSSSATSGCARDEPRDELPDVIPCRPRERDAHGGIVTESAFLF